MICSRFENLSMASDERYAAHGEAFARTSLEDFGDSNAIGAKIGFTVSGRSGRPRRGERHQTEL
ncbi:hypothetical protein GFL72_23885 [Rhizobium leguminosarum bv. viciae]|nr:hypothetical protein [Rhizobium leguminosarum bv. viciae]